jgi:hypothetical protein
MFHFKKILSAVLIISSFSVFAAENGIEKIIVIRHGEKPPVEIGQINCMGLNRSLALPHYFATHFPKPNFIFAPNPSVQISAENGEKFSYIRPLATIEPTAISLNMPVNAQIGFNQPNELMNTLLEKKYHDAVIYVAWEHKNIENFGHLILSHFNNKSAVPAWPYTDYNRVYVFTIHWNKEPASITFEKTSEELNHLSGECPK